VTSPSEGGRGVLEVILIFFNFFFLSVVNFHLFRLKTIQIVIYLFAFKSIAQNSYFVFLISRHLPILLLILNLISKGVVVLPPLFQ
jgi:hypothetical protein